jgi:lipopolysaccharide/colanic/teichoic acid biosynthesis glycosyltransferase
MTPAKRSFDLVLAAVLALPVACAVALLAVAILLIDGAPVFHVGERMRSPGRAFGLVKLRSMRQGADDGGATGPDKAAAVTRLGPFLRRTRLDELPQIWNILRGDLSFVGPRPPLRRYVERSPELYALVLQSRPGVTGLATLCFRAHEERVLAACRSAAETDAAYMRRCVARKARIDLIYQRRRSLWLDLALILRTAGVPILTRPGQRAAQPAVSAPRAGPGPGRMATLPAPVCAPTRACGNAPLSGPVFHEPVGRGRMPS